MRKQVLLNVIIFVTLLMAIGVNVYNRGREKVAAFVGGTELQSIAPEADSFRKKEEPFLYYEIYKKNRLIGYCFNTKDVAPEKKGHVGPIEMLVALDRNHRIENLKVLRHTETAKYADRIRNTEFLDQFKGKGPKDAFIVGKDIHGITHATISTRGVASTLKTSTHKMQAIIHGVEDIASQATALDLDKDFYITIFIITFLLIAFYLKAELLRQIGLASSIVYFGFIKANFISMSNLGSIFLWNLPDLSSNVSWFVFIFSGLVLTFLLGAFYCSYMCPFGALQIFLGKIFKFNIKITSALAGNLRKIKFFLLWALSFLVLTLNNSNSANYEPFSTVFLRRGSVVAWSIVLIILVLSLFHHRPFCNYFCASGAFLEMTSKLGRRIFKRRRK
ncbi:4Fe-4S binding protein [Candidatus Omnitrophota bacterium]